MKEITDKNFGLIIAFLLPGFLLLWALSLSDMDNAEIGTWPKGFSDPSVSGFLYVTLASLAVGLIISAIRWAVIDHVLRWYYLRSRGKPLPEIDLSKLNNPDKFALFQGANENHYRYYQYYSNTLIAIIVGCLNFLIRGKVNATWPIWLGVGVLCLVLLAASKDSFFKYHERVSEIAHGPR